MTAQARGSFVASWDDDDYFRPHRLAAQVAPLVRRPELHLTVLEHHYYMAIRERAQDNSVAFDLAGAHSGECSSDRSVPVEGEVYCMVGARHSGRHPFPTEATALKFLEFATVKRQTSTWGPHCGTLVYRRSVFGHQGDSVPVLEFPDSR